MPTRILKKMGIKTRIFIAAILPLMLMSILLGSYYIMKWEKDAFRRINDNGARYSRDLSRLSEFSLFTDDTEFLDVLSRSLFSDPDVYSVRIRGKDNKDIIYRISPRYLKGAHSNHSRSVNDDLVFKTMVYPGQLTTFDGKEFYDIGSPPSVSQANLLGSIEVTMTDAHELELKDAMIRDTLLIILAVLGATVTLAFSISSRITRPIVHMKENIAKLASGDIILYRTSKYPDELGELENAFYDMAVAVHNAKFELQKRVDIATARHQETIANLEKTNAELTRAREQLSQANEAKSEFMARMSHEIRTPLHSIIGYLSLIKKTDIDSTQAEYIRVIDSASRHLMLLINDILDISSLDSRGVELSHDGFNLRQCIEDVVLLLAPRAREKVIEFVFLIDSDVPILVSGDQYYLKQILINLLGNAIKFTDSGEVILHVSLESDDIDTAVVSMKIVDTGVGIDAEQIERIQSPFYQVDSSRTRDHEGTGLGLAIVKKLLAMMGAELSIDSTPGKGSTFCFSITLEKQQSASMVADNYISNSLGHIKILCFDSHALALRALRNQILNWTSQVYTATSIERIGELIDMAEQSGAPFDLLILGVNRDLLNSAEFIPKLRRCVNNRLIALLLMVGNSEHLDCESLGLTNRCSSIKKPASETFIHNTILSLLDTIAATAPRQAEASSTMTTPATSVEGTRGARRILLAEDNKFNRNYVTKLLREKNLHVTEATSGGEALKLVTTEAFDLILMDIHLPESDGITIARRIKVETGPNQSTPVLALTADMYVQETSDYRNAGFAGIIAKPIDEVRFWQVLDEHLRLPDGASFTTSSGRLDKIKQTLLPQLLRELPEYSRQIQQAFEAREHGCLVDLLHQLKGISGYFNLPTLSAIISEAEGLVRDTWTPPDWDELAPLIRKLREHIDMIIAQVSS